MRRLEFLRRMAVTLAGVGMFGIELERHRFRQAVGLVTVTEIDHKHGVITLNAEPVSDEEHVGAMWKKITEGEDKFVAHFYHDWTFRTLKIGETFHVEAP